jgi:predicted RNA-binding protein with TRAM domain
MKEAALIFSMSLLGRPPLTFILVLAAKWGISMSSGTEDGGQGSGDDSQSTQRSSGPSKEKPVKVGEEIDVTVSELSRRGDGVARIQGFVIFIPNTKQGMQAKIRIKEIRPNFATAELIESGPSS